MASQVVAALETLLAEVPGADAMWLERWDPPAEALAPEQLEAHFAELAQVFEAVVAEIAGDWGEPHYRGSAEQEDFPGWSAALLLASWLRDGHTAFVALRQDDDTEPMFIELGAATAEEIATLALGSK
ncbi:MAG: hypothetical protein ACRD0X_06970 [Thermoanaerobaculia bacterium]